MNAPQNMVTDLFAGMNLELVSDVIKEPSSKSKVREGNPKSALAEAIMSRDVGRVREVLDGSTKLSKVPIYLGEHRSADLVASYFSKDVAELLLKHGLPVPQTKSFMDHLHSLDDVKTLDWFIENTLIGQVSAKNNSKQGEMHFSAFMQPMRMCLNEAKVALSLYYLNECRISSDPKGWKGDNVFFHMNFLKLFSGVVRAGDVHALEKVVAAIHRHGHLATVVKSFLPDMTMEQLRTIFKASQNSKVRGCLTSVFPINIEVNEYARSPLLLLHPEHSITCLEGKVNLSLGNMIEAATVMGSPAVIDLMKDEKMGPVVASYLTDQPDASFRLSYFSWNVREKTLKEMLSDLYKWKKGWRDAERNGVGHYLAAKPSSDTTRDARVRVGKIMVSMNGTADRGEMILKFAPEWAVSQNIHGKTPMSFARPKAVASMTRRALLRRGVGARVSPRVPEKPKF